MLELIWEMIHENNTAPAERIVEKKISEFEVCYDSINLYQSLKEVSKKPKPAEMKP